MKDIGTVINENFHINTSKLEQDYNNVLEQNKTFQSLVKKLNLLSEKIKELQSNYEQTITLCNDLKQSILKDIFG